MENKLLTQAKIQNFQSIKELDIDLNAPVVMFTGATDSGKSAILRAIKNAIFDGTGANFYRIENGKKKGTMNIQIKSTNSEINWEKTKNNATYIINGAVKPDCGKIVPPEVAEALGLTSEKDLEENLHYRDQFQSAFLLKDRGPKESYRLISRVMGADVIIQILDALEKENRNISTEEKAYQKRLEEALLALNNYYPSETIDAMRLKIGDMEMLDHDMKDCEAGTELLTKIKEKKAKAIQIATKVQSINSQVMMQELYVQKMETQKTKLFELNEHLKALVILKNKIFHYQNEKEKYAKMPKLDEAECQKLIRKDMVNGLNEKYDTCHCGSGKKFKFCCMV